MYVSAFNKVQYIVSHYAISKEEYNELINKFSLHTSSINKPRLDFDQELMDDNSPRLSYDIWGSLYDGLIKKYEITNESIEETIKDQLYRSRTGFFTKCASNK